MKKYKWIRLLIVCAIFLPQTIQAKNVYPVKFAINDMSPQFFRVNILSSNFTQTLMVKSLVNQTLKKEITRKDVFLMLDNLKYLSKETATFYIKNESSQISDNIKTGGLLDDKIIDKISQNKKLITDIHSFLDLLEGQYHEVNRPGYAKIIDEFKKNEWIGHLNNLGFEDEN